MGRWITHNGRHIYVDSKGQPTTPPIVEGTPAAAKEKSRVTSELEDIISDRNLNHTYSKDGESINMDRSSGGRLARELHNQGWLSGGTWDAPTGSRMNVVDFVNPKISTTHAITMTPSGPTSVSIRVSKKDYDRKLHTPDPHIADKI